jgi:hypothetical protein
MADDSAVDISGMPDPPSDLIGTGPAQADISGMPTPSQLFKQRVGRDPENNYELQQFLTRPEDFGAPTQTNTLLGAGELAGGAVANIPHAALGAAADITNRITGSNLQAPSWLEVPRGAAAQDLIDKIKANTPKTPNGLDVSDAELRETIDPEGKIPIEKLRALYKTASDKSLSQLLQESGTVKGDVVGGALDVGSDVATLEGTRALAVGAAKAVAPHLNPKIPAGTQFDSSGTAITPGTPPGPPGTPPAPPTSGPVSAEQLRAQPDPLAPAPPAAAAAPTSPPTGTIAPSETGAAPSPSNAAPRVPVPGKPHIRPKVPPTAEPVAPETQNPTPIGDTVAPGTQPAAIPAAVGTGFTAPQAEGARAGALPPEVQAGRMATLQGLNDLAGGQLGEVRTSALTGDTAEAGTDFQDSKIQDAGGKRMQGVIAGETNALRGATDNLAARTGGAAEGTDQGALSERGGVIAHAISRIEQWFDDNIRQTYDTARARARGVPVTRLDGVASFMRDQTPEFLGTVEGAQLLHGVRAQLGQLGLLGPNEVFNPATVDQAERFRQYLGRQWTPTTAGLINQIRDSLDLDVAKSGGADLFDQARSLRARKARMLEDPTGISKLLHPEDRLGINRAVPLEQIPDYVANLPRQQFQHVTNVLKSAAHLGDGELAEDAAAALREIKGHMAARLQEAGGSKIQGGWSASGLYKQLDKYSQKMPEVFSPDEMKDWKTVNDASNILRMDRTYPGAAAQTHNTGIMDQLREKAGKGARALTDVAAHHALPIAGPAIAEVTGLSERVAHAVGGNPELKRLAKVESRISKVAPREAPTTTPLGQRLTGASQRGGPKLINNASGESSASAEAQSRVVQEKVAGQHRYSIDPDGNVTPLTGVDAVDARAPQGHIIVQRGIGLQPYSILDRGGLPQAQANGLLARATGLGKLAEAERARKISVPKKQRG